MSRILKVSQSNYSVQVQTGGRITLDTGFNTGEVFITGDLIVQGETTTINTTNLFVEDNLILLNKGESGLGVTERTAGIQVQRSVDSANALYPDSELLWSELVTHYNPITTVVATSTSGVDHSVTVNSTGPLFPNTLIQFTGTVGASGLTEGVNYYIKAVTPGSNKITLSTTIDGNGLAGSLFTGVSTATGLSLAVSILGEPGTWVFQHTSGKIGSLRVSTIVAPSATNIAFDMQNSTKVLTIANSPSYDLYVANDNDIVTKKWTQTYVAASGGIADVTRFKYPLYGPTQTQGIADATTLQFQINSGFGLVTKAYVSSNGLNIDSTINLANSIITGTSVSDNLKLTTLNGTYVEIQPTLELTDQSAFETVTDSGKTKIYSRSNLTTLAQTPGRTGIFFRNSVGNGELVSKNRAVLLSILL